MALVVSLRPTLGNVPERSVPSSMRPGLSSHVPSSDLARVVGLTAVLLLAVCPRLTSAQPLIRLSPVYTEDQILRPDTNREVSLRSPAGLTSEEWLLEPAVTWSPPGLYRLRNRATGEYLGAASDDPAASPGLALLSNPSLQDRRALWDIRYQRTQADPFGTRGDLAQYTLFNMTLRYLTTDPLGLQADVAQWGYATWSVSDPSGQPVPPSVFASREAWEQPQHDTAARTPMSEEDERARQIRVGSAGCYLATEVPGRDEGWTVLVATDVGVRLFDTYLDAGTGREPGRGWVLSPDGARDYVRDPASTGGRRYRHADGEILDFHWQLDGSAGTNRAVRDQMQAQFVTQNNGRRVGYYGVPLRDDFPRARQTRWVSCGEGCQQPLTSVTTLEEMSCQRLVQTARNR